MTMRLKLRVSLAKPKSQSSIKTIWPKFKVSERLVSAHALPQSAPRVSDQNAPWKLRNPMCRLSSRNRCIFVDQKSIIRPDGLLTQASKHTLVSLLSTPMAVLIPTPQSVAFAMETICWLTISMLSAVITHPPSSRSTREHSLEVSRQPKGLEFPLCLALKKLKFKAKKKLISSSAVNPSCQSNKDPWVKKVTKNLKQLYRSPRLKWL